eukprot:g30229.t1
MGFGMLAFIGQCIESVEEEEVKEEGEWIPVRINCKKKTCQASTGPQQNGKKQLHDGHNSSSSDNENMGRDSHQHKKRQNTTGEKERSIPNPDTPDITSERLAILQHLPLLLAKSRPVIVAENFNFIFDADGQSRGGRQQTRFLMDTVKGAKLHDIFSTPAGGVQSTNIKLVFFSDYCLLLADCHLQDNQVASNGMWKLNVKLLTPEHIEELKRDYTGDKESSVFSSLKEED